MSEKEVDKLINDPRLLKFKPEHKFLRDLFTNAVMTHVFKKNKHYRHFAVIVLKSDPETEYVHEFSNQPDARNHVRSSKKAKNIAEAKYERVEIKEFDEGFIV